MAEAAADGDQPRYSIDELAQRSGFTARNIRAFQVHGMLPAPTRTGRTAYYEPRHLTRLELIERLQAQGFSRAAIGSLVQAWDSGQSLSDVLGLVDELGTLIQPQANPRITLFELAERFGPEYAALQRTIEIGLLVQVDDTDEFEITNQVLFDLGFEMLELGLPLDVILDQSQFVRETADEIAERFVDMFLDTVFEPFVERGSPPEEVPHITETLRRLKPMIERGLTGALEVSVSDAVTRVLRQIADED